jgi:hypothetical protein
MTSRITPPPPPSPIHLLTRSIRPVLTTGSLMMAGLLFAGGCQKGFVEMGKPLTIRVSVDRTEGQVGQELTFVVEATGTQLQQVSIQFGDGGGESLSATGADTAAMMLTHTYGGAGTFQVTASAACRSLANPRRTTSKCGFWKSLEATPSCTTAGWASPRIFLTALVPNGP